MRKDNRAYMFYMSELERNFINEMAYVNKLPLAQYLKSLIREEMKKNPEVLERLKRKENG